MPKRSLSHAVLLLSSALAAAPARAAPVAPEPDLASMSLDRLLELPVTGASKVATTLVETAGAVTVVTREEIRALGCRTIADVLARIKGVMVTTDRSYSYLGVRGFYAPGDYNTRVLLLIDGARVNDALYDQAYVGSEFPLDIELVDRIEFIPGQASAVYGANALFGVVNVVTRKPAAGAPLVAEVSAGSHGERRLRVEDTVAADNGLVARWSASVYGLRGQDVDVAGTVAPHGDFEQRTNLALQVRWGELAFSAVGSHRTRGNPFSLDTVAGAPDTRNIDDQALFDLSWSGKLADGDEATVRAFAGDYRFTGLYAMPGVPATINEDRDVARWWGVEARVTTSRLDGHRITLGGELQRSPELVQYNADVAPPGAAFLDASNPGRRAALFLEDQVRITDRLTLDASVRSDETPRFGSNEGARFALIWRRGESLAVKAIWGSAYRTPNDYEANYTIPGVGGYDVNPGLRTEAVHGTELNIEWHPDRADLLSGSVYQNVARSLVVLGRDADGDGFMFTNQGRVVATGLELEWQHTWSSGLRMRGNLSLQGATDHDTSVPVATYAPDYLVDVSAIVPVPGGLQAGVTWRAVAQRGAAGGYAVADLALSTPERPRGWSWSLSVANLFDRRYADPGADLDEQPVIAQAGRSVQFSLSRSF
jgi:iron complex outermembrane receptor protein